jgi:hypothetical protein
VASRASLKKRLAALEQVAHEGIILGVIVYDGFTGETIATGLDGREYRGAEAERLIALQSEPVLAIRGISLDLMLGRIKYPGGPMDEAIEKWRAQREGQTETESSTTQSTPESAPCR